VTNWNNSCVKHAIISADLIVDATTTLEVPRDLSQRRGVPRAVSAFLTPSGKSSILLFEPADLSLRLDSLEAQYYRSIINTDWGEKHLQGHQGALWVGAGCRDVSAIISNEDIQVHAATLARQIRLLRDKPEPHIRVWSSDIETGGLNYYEVPVFKKIEVNSGDWNVIFDEEIKKKLIKIRNIHLPDETGGVILGYIDQKIKAIYVVDVLEAPLDSESDQTGFVRGVRGLKATLNEILRRTANIVGYIGEWHSHPAFSSAYPSNLDRALIEKLSNILALDGQPALMVIAGQAGDISVIVKGG
jgi:integrative and conjugative element protein (TIGR02256 family)